jgi:predicted tellurium resistance membrane protein TerC
MTVYFHEEDLPEGVLAPGAVAVDTEAMGLFPGRDRLCLVQISDGGGDEHLVIMVIAVVAAVLVMLLAAEPLANFINHNPTIVMLALGFLLMIGVVLVADGFGVHVPKGYIYTAMAFSAAVEGLNMAARRRRERAAKAGQ